MNITTSLSPCCAGPKPHELCRYELVAQSLYLPELGTYRTYGIRIAVPAHLDVLRDVSPCRETAEYVVKHLNRYQVSPVHVYDVVEDLLSQWDLGHR